MAIKIEERSLELAIVKAASRLGVTQSDLSYRVLNKNAGFLGIFGKKIEIEAWKKNSSYNSNIKKQYIKACSSEENELQQDLKQFLEEIYRRMFGRHVNIDVQIENDERMIFNIDCSFLASQIKNNTKIAESFEHLLRKRPRHIKSELPFRIFVDAQDTRLNKEQELVIMAHDLSNKVYENQKPIILNYQSPYDRKIIHLALDQDKRVYTKSIGVGHNRKLMILPSREAHA